MNISGKTIKVRNCRIHYQLYVNNCGSASVDVVLLAVAPLWRVHPFKASQADEQSEVRKISPTLTVELLCSP